MSDDSDADESMDCVPTMPFVDEDVLLAILRAKNGDPNLFQSFWEMDEQGVEEVTMEEIQKDPSKKILWAAENNHLDIAEDLLSKDPNLVHTVDEDLYSPLHRASYNGHTDMIKLLLSKGASIKAETGDGWHPIHSASRWNQADVVSLLLQNGANINAQTHGGLTPLHLASSEQDCRDTLKLLLNHKDVDTSLKSKLGQTAYDICRRTSENCVLFETAGKV